MTSLESFAIDLVLHVLQNADDKRMMRLEFETE
jgi:hypothetical protein